MTEGVCVLGGVGGVILPLINMSSPTFIFGLNTRCVHICGNTLVGTSPAKRDDPSAISQDFFLLCCQERGYQRRFHPNAGGELSSSRLLLDLGLLACL